MFKMATVLYGSSFKETAATQICGRPQGISLTSLFSRTCLRQSDHATNSKLTVT